jgi:hypothetical protein
VEVIMKWVKRIGIGAVVVLLVAVLGFVGWTMANRYQAQPSEMAPPIPTDAPRRAWRVFKPSTPTETGFIFYPGGLVEADAYAWLGPQFAQRGIFTVIVPMPLDLAVLNPSEANRVLAAFPEIKTWAIGGHSLGGAMSGQFMMRYPDAIDRVNKLILWGARLTDSMDLTAKPIKVASVFGTLDTVAPPDLTDEMRLVGLPRDTTSLFPVEGGNHSMFGDYGLQSGDTPLAIPLEEARQQIIEDSMTVFK